VDALTRTRHQHLGETTTTQHAPTTAIDRARVYLETASTAASSAGTTYQAQDRQLLQRANQLVDNYQYCATDTEPPPSDAWARFYGTTKWLKTNKSGAAKRFRGLRVGV
jgi:hypothetical protein